MKAEDVKVGGYQILTLLLLSVNLIIVAMSHVLSIFYKYTPKLFYCQEAQSNALSPVLLDGVDEHVTKRTYGCRSPCPGDYLFVAKDRENDIRSVAMEWQLICEREYLLSAILDVYYIGSILGGIVAGILADRIGRLPVLAMCLYAQGTMAVALYVVQEYQLFLVFRGLQTFFVQGLESCTFILCMELFPARFRTLIGLIILSMRAFGMAMLAGLSYAITDWRILQLVVSVPTAVTVLYIWLLPESPRWLLARNKLTEAEIILDRVAHYNGVICGGNDTSKNEPEKRREKPQKPKRKIVAKPSEVVGDNTKSTDLEKSVEEAENLLPDMERTHVSAEEKNVEEMINMGRDRQELNADEIGKACDDKSKSPSYLLVSREANGKTGFGIFGFLDSKFAWRILIVQMCLWFCSSTAFHVLITLPNKISTERHISLTLAAGMEIVAFVLAFFIVSSRFGRRRALCLAQTLVGLASITITVLLYLNPQAPPKWFDSTKTAVVSIARFSNVVSFFILRLVVVEVFPTTSRGTGLGLCIAAEMIGGLLVSHLNKIDVFMPEYMRMTVGVLCICIGPLALLLPEAGREILPDTPVDVRNLGKQCKNENDDPVVLRKKLFSEDWVDAGNGIIVNFKDNKNPESSED